MKTWEYLANPEMAGLVWPALFAGLAIAVLCSTLSVLVVLRRMAFIGQGISHAAFGGVGVAACVATAWHGAGALPAVQFAIVLVFCFGAAMLIGLIAARGKTEADSAIGIVLVFAMAMGAVLLRAAGTNTAVESFLFGDILTVRWADAALAWGAAGVVVGVLWVARRPMRFWAFDEPAAAAWGVPSRAMSLLLLAMLALATVTAMKLAGVVLTTAMLVLPGASALRVSRRWRTVQGACGAVALLGVAGGIVASFELDLAVGPAIVLVLTLLYGLARAGEWVRNRRPAAYDPPAAPDAAATGGPVP